MSRRGLDRFLSSPIFGPMRSAVLSATLSLTALVGCRPEPVAIAEPTVYGGCGQCGCWVPDGFVEAWVPADERGRLRYPRQLLHEVALHRARAQGAEPDTSSQCYGEWWGWVLASGPDSAAVAGAFEAVGATPRPSPFTHRDTLWHMRAEVGPPEVSDLIQSPALVSVSSSPPQCMCITSAMGSPLRLSRAVGRAGGRPECRRSPQSSPREPPGLRLSAPRRGSA